MPVRRPTKRPLSKKARTDSLFGKPLSNSDKCEIQEIETIYGAEFEPESLEDFRVLRQLAESRWKMRRADEMEVELFSANMPDDEQDPDMALAKAFMKDANGERVLAKIITYRERAEIIYYKSLRLLQSRKKGLALRNATPGSQPQVEPVDRSQPPKLVLIRGKRPRGQASGPAGMPLMLIHGSKRPPNLP